MKSKKISEVIDNINPKYIEEAVSYTGKERTSRRPVLIKWGAIAACLAVTVIAATLILPSMLKTSKPHTEQNDRYKDFVTSQANTAIVWGWDERTTSEKYSRTEINGATYYVLSSRAISVNLVGEKINSYEFYGFDEETQQKHTETFEVYQMKNLPEDLFLAVYIEDEYFVLKKKESYNPPATLGELFELIDLEQVIELKRFYEEVDYLKTNYYALNNDDYIWDVLKECSSARFFKDDEFYANERKHIDFSVTSEAIGVYKCVLTITEDGFLSTNIFSYGYRFDIGKENAKKIIDYAKKNSAAAEYEPYELYIIGEVIEITDEYLLIDDSFLCNNSEDGVTYKVLLNDKRIRRYVERTNYIAKGRTVKVVYDGEIQDGNPKIISSGREISNIRISFGDEEEKKYYGGSESSTVSHSISDVE